MGERLTIIVLEIGTFTGYSALAWAEALKGVEGAEVCLHLDEMILGLNIN